jgi:hypothetical protein|nr:MAG TPA: hypothetical protein [Caudoviricetes sp.]
MDNIVYTATVEGLTFEDIKKFKKCLNGTATHALTFLHITSRR